MASINDVVGNCPRCGATIHGFHISQRCTNCDAPLPEPILAALRDAGSGRSRPEGAAPRSPARSFVTRYHDAYRIAGTVNSIGSAVKGLGILLGVLIALAGSREPGVFAFGGILVGLAVGAVLFCVGTLIAAIAQMNQATLDVAVYECPFMSEAEKASALNLQFTADPTRTFQTAPAGSTGRSA